MNGAPEVRTVPILAKTFASADTTGGKSLRVELGDLPMSRAGMEAHLAAVRIECTQTYTPVAANTTEAMPGHLFYTALKNIRLESEGHPFLDNVDGLDLRRAFHTRFGVEFETVPADIADAANAQATQATSWTYRLNDPRKAHPYSRDGLVPLRLFDHLKSGQNVLSFDINTTYDNFGGVSVDNLGAMKVWVHVVYLRKVRLASPQRLWWVSTSETDVKLEPRGRIGFLIVSDRKVTAGTYGAGADHSDYSNIELQLGSESLFNGRAATDLAIQANVERLAYPGVTAYSTTAPNAVVLIVPQPQQVRSGMYRGRVRCIFGTRSNHSASRFLVYEYGRMTNDLATRWARRLGIEQPKGDEFEPLTGPDGKGLGMAAELDHAVFHPNLASEIPRQKSKK